MPHVMVLAQHVCPMGESRGFLVGPVISGRCDLMNDGTTAAGNTSPPPQPRLLHGTPPRAAPEPARPEAGESGAARRHAEVVAGGRGGWWLAGRDVGGWLPLVVVLVLQAGLSVRLVGADTAFQDEAEYLWAGHLEWSHWLHGTVVPPFASYFSGAPGIYPPLAALAGTAGGLAAARLLSLVFMLGATALLWAAAGRLFGRRAAFFSCALFALSGPALHLGAFATYDAMSVFLLALASWLVVSASGDGEAAGRMALAGVVMAAANATAYSTTLFDPVVILLALLTAWPARRTGWPPAAPPRCSPSPPRCSSPRCCSAGPATPPGSARPRCSGPPGRPR